MARDILRTSIRLGGVRCFDEGDGWGDAEPYLWTLFFRIDGQSVTYSDGALHGSGFTQDTPGSHMNLNTRSVVAGDVVAIPEAIGLFETLVYPIPLGFLDANIGGAVGVVCVLMEEDNVSDDGAEAGHRAFNDAVRGALAKIISTRSVTEQEVTDEALTSFTEAVKAAVLDAIEAQQNLFENLWSLFGKDDFIGSKVFTFQHDDLAADSSIRFEQRFDTKKDGSWLIFGTATTTVACSADAIAALAEALSDVQFPAQASPQAAVPSRFEKTLTAMRDYRRAEFSKTAGVRRWWALAERHAPQVAIAVAADPTLRATLGRLLEAMPALLKNRNTVLPKSFADDAQKVLDALRKNGSRRARIDASRASDMLQRLGGKTMKAALDLLDRTPPARHPVVSPVSVPAPPKALP
jgi:hypothetical protein